MTDIAKIAGSLTEAQKKTIKYLDGHWQPGPSMLDKIIDQLLGLRDLGLVERHFMDEGPPVHSVGESCLSVRLSACWHFRLTEIGLAVRAYLLKGESDVATP